MKALKRKILSAGIIMTAVSSCFASPNNFMLSYYGNSPGVGINYERQVYSNIWLGAGISYASTDELWGTDLTTIGVPVSVTGLFFEGEHKLEVGGGLTYVSHKLDSKLGDNFSIESSGLYAIATFGYRYMPAKGFNIRAVISPIVGDEIRFGAGLGIGYSF